MFILSLDKVRLDESVGEARLAKVRLDKVK